jgi:putative regulator of septum formation
MRSIAVRLGIVVVLALIGFLGQQYFSNSANKLGVGDCFDLPATATDTVEDVQHHPCTDAHFAEVVYVGTYGGTETTYPSDDTFRQFFADHCIAAYQDYTGDDILASGEMDMGFFYPTSDGWSKGDKKITCYAYQVDEAKLTTSIKKK